MKLRERRLVLAGLAVPLVLVMAAGFSVFASRGGRGSTSKAPQPQAAWAEPISGDLLLTISDARTRVTYPIPLLPGTTLTDPCSGSPTTLTLQQVWASETFVAQEERQVALTYNLGIWMTTTPKMWFTDDVANANDLPTAATAYGADDYPGELTDGSVRGHSAWLKEMSARFSCSSAQSWAADAGSGSGGQAPAAPVVPEASPTSSPPPTTLGPVYYGHASVAHVVWMENGVVIDLTGPFSTAQLAQIAAGITFA